MNPADKAADDRWTLKRGRRRPSEGASSRRSQTELVIPVFGYKNHVGIDRRHRFMRSFTVTDAATHDGGQLGRLLDPDNTASPVWADVAYRSAANVALLTRRGLVPSSGGRSRAGGPCRRTSRTATPARGAGPGRDRARVRPPGSAASACSSARSDWPGPLVTNMRGLVWLELRPRPA